jgi:hypothetical protein
VLADHFSVYVSILEFTFIGVVFTAFVKSVHSVFAGMDKIEPGEGDDTMVKTAPRVFLGGGVEAGAWAAELEALKASQGALIISVGHRISKSD